MTPDQIYVVYQVAGLGALAGALCGSLIAVVLVQMMSGGEP